MTYEIKLPALYSDFPYLNISRKLKIYTSKSTSPLPSCIDESGKLEIRIKIPSLTISLTKAQLMMLFELTKSWVHENPGFFSEMLVDDVFHPKGIDLYSKCTEIFTR